MEDRQIIDMYFQRLEDAIVETKISMADCWSQ